MDIKRGFSIFVISALATYSILATRSLFKEIDDSTEKEGYYEGYIKGFQTRSLRVWRKTMEAAKRNMTEEQYAKFLLDCGSIYGEKD